MIYVDCWLERGTDFNVAAGQNTAVTGQTLSVMFIIYGAYYWREDGGFKGPTIPARY